ncbi:cation:proton antiporter [Thiocapsa bogorovii]|uniref:cation:proton antiporter n=1 Tax=Thiocapsa bogorovii TaxID=521689 RepID=UPI001E55DDE7|nr:cation:proton antiporter [Thiocapsa bogorovii]UHD15242.1 cation:proton antiporter [Thiocapsa bogorovii]
MYATLVLLGLFVFVYSAIAGGVERTPVTGPIVFTAFGLALGPVGLGWLHLDLDQEGLRTLAELTLALVLFTDAATADLSVLGRSWRIPERLLGIGLPLTIVLGFAAGVLLFPELGWLEIAILATMLAPTDAALGKAVVTNTSVPANVREGLNVESGLNDGICVPILLALLALATGVEQYRPGFSLGFFAEAIGIGVAVGVALTLAAAWLLRLSTRQGWITETWRQLPVVALALSCFGLAQWLGGSGFIAAFAGGLLYGALAKQEKHALLLAAEGTGDTLALVTWVAFGAGVVGQTMGYISGSVLLYAVLSLTLIRMVPVYLSLWGLPLRPDAKLFIGWFGPRGLASIVFGILVFTADLPGGDTLTVTAVCTILLSILLHGLTANPLVGAFAKGSGRGCDG